uniref:Uncharacterized protein n=1 Tax=Arundo donax TaxID=35708 RepID=A0A0A8XX42_ARUDO
MPGERPHDADRR